MLAFLPAPAVERGRVVVDLCRTCRMELHNLLVIPEEQRLDATHLLPGRTARGAQNMNGYMIPARSVRKDDSQDDVLAKGNQAGAVRAILVSGSQEAIA